MASLLRTGVFRTPSNGLLPYGLCKVTGNRNVLKTQVAFIAGKILRSQLPPRLPPFPYETTKYGIWYQWLDNTLDRMNCNSKIVTVEGPVAAGKTKFAQELAEELDMLYMPRITLDKWFINSYGFDYKTLNSKLPPGAQLIDTTTFCEDPHHINVPAMQCHMYTIKFGQYIDACAHVLNTGQGVILERCVYSDYVFMEALVKVGFASDEVYGMYKQLQNATKDEILKPHLVIYLDVPVDITKENIKKRGLPHEVNSKALSTEFLSAMEHVYKTKYLKEISTHANVLIYDWSKPGDTEAIVEDIERLNFDDYDKHDPKMKDWRFATEEAACTWRRDVTEYKMQTMQLCVMPRYDIPEMVRNAAENEALIKALADAPGYKYEEGYNTDLGDKGLLFKLKRARRRD